MNELYEQARLEAIKQTWQVAIEIDKLSDGSDCYLAYHPELPGCMAQGLSEAQARAELDSARIDYIYSLIMNGLWEG